jgi:hypothetical protein
MIDNQYSTRDVDLEDILRSKAVDFVRKNPATSLEEFSRYLWHSVPNTSKRKRTIDDTGRTDGEGLVIWDGAPEGYPVERYLEIVRADLKTVLRT